MTHVSGSNRERINEVKNSLVPAAALVSQVVTSRKGRKIYDIGIDSFFHANIRGRGEAGIVQRDRQQGGARKIHAHGGDQVAVLIINAHGGRIVERRLTVEAVAVNLKGNQVVVVAEVIVKYFTSHNMSRETVYR